MKFKYLFLFLLLIEKTNSFASSLSLEIGQTKAIFNRFAIPNTNEDRISLPVEDSLTSYRITGFIDLKSGNQIYFLLAPLSTRYQFESGKNFEFDGINFSEGLNTDVNYKFNSYRLGYLWNWNVSSLKLWGGIVGKIRDAEIEVSQGDTSQVFDNVGFVPLASFGFQYHLFDKVSLFLHTDALTASQGAAYDSQLEVRFGFNEASFSFGKRVLGGGADNDKVYNFAQFDTFYFAINYSF